MKNIHYSLFIILCALACTSCTRQPKQVVYATTEAIPVNANADGIQDAAYLAQLAPIKENLEQAMNVQIGYAPERLWVNEPECPMLNWASDALWEAAKQAYPGKVDIAIVNMGGMRCEWPAGPITRGSVFELMPFDNRLVVLTLKGSDVLALCESFARYGGQGVAGMRVTIVNGQVANITIGGKALNTRKSYTVATSDYLSGGADHMEALTQYTDCWNSDLIIRELYLDAVQRQDTIRAKVDGRMTIL
ncbi:MAG: 5'-nucleotidase C-terminal domain-containing protein [Paludibacteraceae bacterium]|nr:5'-nucleotidase C-terminal domain-containing protein [Paludibacteraceae bacterium]